jgi:hypothetical protein
MSEASRQRWLRVMNRLEELRAKHGMVVSDPLPEVEQDPTWGPLGSLVKQTLPPGDYDCLLKQHQEMLILEHSKDPSQNLRFIADNGASSSTPGRDNMSPLRTSDW